jgi:hypothetical protein
VTGADESLGEADHDVEAAEEQVAQDHGRALAPLRVLDVSKTRVTQHATLTIHQSLAGRFNVAAVTAPSPDQKYLSVMGRRTRVKRKCAEAEKGLAARPGMDAAASRKGIHLSR